MDKMKVIVGILIVIVLASGIGTVSAFSNSGDGDWKYYKEITVKENSGKTLTNFQVLIELNSANFDFSKAKSDDKAAELAKKDIAKGLNKAKKYSPINVASASSNDQSDGLAWYENISWDKIKGIEHAKKIMNSEEILNYGDEFEFVDKPLDEPIKPPEETVEEFFMEHFWYDEEGYPHYKDFKIAPSDWAVWGVAYVGSDIDPNLPILPVDTDKDGKPEILMPAVTDYMLRNTDLKSIGDNIVCCTLPTGERFIKYRTYYILDPSHKPEDENIPGILKLLYTDSDWKIVPLKGKDVVEPLYWKEVVGKTPYELGLDKDDRGIFGRTPSQTSSPAETTPSEVPTGEEKGIPGFEAIFAVAGLLVVVYLLRRQNK